VISIKVRVSQRNQMLLLFNLANKPLTFMLESDGSCNEQSKTNHCSGICRRSGPTQ